MLKKHILNVMIVVMLIVSVFSPMLITVKVEGKEADKEFLSNPIIPTVNSFTGNFTYYSQNATDGYISSTSENSTWSMWGNHSLSTNVWTDTDSFYDDIKIGRDYSGIGSHRWAYQRGYFDFDTSNISVNYNITNASLMFQVREDSSGIMDFNISLYSIDYGTSLDSTVSDWNATGDYVCTIYNSTSPIGWYNISIPTTYINPNGHTQFKLKSSIESTYTFLNDSYVRIYAGNDDYKPGGSKYPPNRSPTITIAVEEKQDIYHVNETITYYGMNTTDGYLRSYGTDGNKVVWGIENISASTYLGADPSINDYTIIGRSKSIGNITKNFYRTYLSFDTSNITSTTPIKSVKLVVTYESKSIAYNEFDIEVYLTNFGTSLNNTHEEWNSTEIYIGDIFNSSVAITKQSYNISIPIGYVNTSGTTQFKLKGSNEFNTTFNSIFNEWVKIYGSGGSTEFYPPYLEIEFEDFVANAGNDVYSAGWDAVELNASASTGDIINYTWTFVYNGTNQTLYGEVVSFDFNNYSFYNATLTTTSYINTTDTDIKAIVIYTIPIANDGGPYYSYTNSTINLNATASTDNITISNYTWLIDGHYYYGNLTPVNTSMAIYNAGTYNVVLRIHNSLGFKDWDNTTLKLQDYPIANGTNQTIPPGNCILDGSNSAGENLYYTWNFVNNSIPTELHGVNPSYVFITPGIHNITLTVEDGNFTHSSNCTVTVIPAIADAGPDDLTGKGIYNFDGSNSWGNTLNYSWNFTYNSVEKHIYGVTPSYDFQISGLYNVTLNVTGLYGDYDLDYMILNVTNLLPIADAGLDDLNNVRGIINLDGSSSYDPDGTITNYTWNFTYNSIPRLIYTSTPSWDFQIIGIYAITLNVTDSDGAHGWDNVTISIINTPPTANAGPDQSGLKGNYTFDGSGSTDDDSISNYTWMFTYNVTLTLLYTVNPSFDFQIGGIYVIQLNVTDSDGDKDYDNVTMIIDLQYPIADAGFDRVFKGNTMFEGTDSTDADGWIVNWTWTLTYNSLPQTVYGETTYFFFNISGVYMVTLTVTDNDGLTDVDFVNFTIVFVWPNAVANSAQGTNKGIYEVDGTSSTDSDGVIVNYTWSFTYGGILRHMYGEHPSYAFLSNGSYEITLLVRDDDWRTNDTKTWVNITHKWPIASGFMSVNDTEKGIKYFNASASIDIDGIIVSWDWYFDYEGLPVVLSGVNVSYNFSTPAIYYVILLVTDDDSHQDNYSFNFIIAFKAPHADAGLNMTVYIWNNKTLSASDSYDEDGIIVNWTWHIIIQPVNNETNATEYWLYGENVTFTFNAEGNVTIILTVTDDDGLTNSTTVYYRITSAMTETFNLLILLIPLVIVLLIVAFLFFRQGGFFESLMGGMTG